jgi:hypothetical protein
MRDASELHREQALELPALRIRRAAAAAAVAVAVLLLLAPGAAGTGRGTGTGAGAAPPESLDERPRGHRMTAREVLRRTDRHPDVRRERAAVRRSSRRATVKTPGTWRVSYYAEGREIAQLKVDDGTGAVLESWTGFQVAWTMARGYRGAFGRQVNSWWLWVPLCLLFLAPFFDRRRPFRLLHLDLLMLLGFSVSLAFFNHGRIGWSVPLVYPFLLYLLGRMLLLARRPPGRAEPLPVHVPVRWLGLGILFLLGFRLGLNVTDSNVIDVGYAGVIGADRLADGEALYGNYPSDNAHGDTYGPVNYYAYVPFEQMLPWSGRWDGLPAAHAAAITFDTLTVVGLWLLGRRLRGRELGVALAYAWVSFPFTLYVLNTNGNDALVSALLVAALLALASPVGRGALMALAGLTKFAPLALVPLLARTGARAGWRPWPLARYLLAFAAVAALALLPFILGGELPRLWERTIAFQEQRGSPFSVWGYHGGLDLGQRVVQGLGALLALAVAFLPSRRRDAVTLSALGAAVVIAVQLGVTHWFYLYIAWFLPLVLVALLARYEGGTATVARSARAGTARPAGAPAPRRPAAVP